MKMDSIDIFSSQESLPLSQESFKHMWQEFTETNVDKLPDEAELRKYLLNDNEIFKMEGYGLDIESPSNDMIIPPSTSAQVITHTDLEVAVNSEIATDDEHTVEDDFVEETQPQVNRSNIPPNTNWPGEHNFEVTFPSQEKSSKSTSWTFSEMKKKLYVNMAVPCPVNFHVKTKPPCGSFVRAMAIFCKPEHVTDVVKRCLNHSSSSDPWNDGHPAPTHLVRCDNELSQYIEDGMTMRHSVITPYENPQVGMEYTTQLYRFMCLGSCVGGLNRRPLKLIFTLETDGHCLGRNVIDLRICACPGRDRRTEEKRLEKQQLKRSSSNLGEMSEQPLLKKQKSESGDEESQFSLLVRRRSHYEFLKRIRDALELSSILTSEEAATLRKRNVKMRKCKRDPQYSSDESST